MSAGVLHHGQHARGAAARTVKVRPMAVAVTAVERVEVPRLVPRPDRHAKKTRLFQVVDTRLTKLLGQRGGHRLSPKMEDRSRGPYCGKSQTGALHLFRFPAPCKPSME